MTVELGALLFKIAFWVYVAATVCYVGGTSEKREGWAKVGLLLIFVGLAGHTASLVVRAVVAGRPPFLNLYEYVLSLTWAAIIVYVVLEKMTKNRTFGAFALPLITIFVWLTTRMPTEVNATMPALNSPWRVPHIATAIFAYASFGIAFGLALMYLLREKFEGKLTSVWVNRLPSTDTVDKVIYRLIAFGFLMQTALLITGAVWAQFAWGRYWGWDPKETWGLVTWLIYAVYLHTRTTLGWRGHKSAVMVVVGFIAVIFTLLGVNYLGGLHSYGS